MRDGGCGTDAGGGEQNQLRPVLVRQLCVHRQGFRQQQKQRGPPGTAGVHPAGNLEAFHFLVVMETL